MTEAHLALCEVLVAARTRAALSQRQLAARLKRAHSYVAKIELGNRRLSVVEFLQLARALGANPGDLLAEVEARQNG